MTIPISTIFEMASYTTKTKKDNMNDLKFTTANDYMQDVEEYRSREDDKIRQIGTCKVRYTSEMIYPKDYVCPRCGFSADEESTK